MRAVVQRVLEACVVVEGHTVGAIGPGLLVYLGAGHGDGDDTPAWMAKKLAGLRIFESDDGKMNRSVSDVAGEVLVVSQFTLYGDVRRGRRPSFDGAAAPERALDLYERTVTELEACGLRVATGQFRATMQVRANVDGPVTILVDSERAF